MHRPFFLAEVVSCWKRSRSNFTGVTSTISWALAAAGGDVSSAGWRSWSSPRTASPGSTALGARRGRFACMSEAARRMAASLAPDDAFARYDGNRFGDRPLGRVGRAGAGLGAAPGGPRRGRAVRDPGRSGRRLPDDRASAWPSPVRSGDAAAIVAAAEPRCARRRTAAATASAPPDGNPRLHLAAALTSPRRAATFAVSRCFAASVAAHGIRLQRGDARGNGLDRERARIQRGRQLVPRQRDRDRRARPGARRIRGDRGAAAVIPEVVDEDLPGALRLRHRRDVALRLVARQPLGHRLREREGVVPRHAALRPRTASRCAVPCRPSS